MESKLTLAVCLSCYRESLSPPKQLPGNSVKLAAFPGQGSACVTFSRGEKPGLGFELIQCPCVRSPPVLGKSIHPRGSRAGLGTRCQREAKPLPLSSSLSQVMAQ